MGLVHNGNIVNYYSLKEEMENSLGGEGQPLEGQNDGELMLRLFQSFFIEESPSSNKIASFHSNSVSLITFSTILICFSSNLVTPYGATVILSTILSPLTIVQAKKE